MNMKAYTDLEQSRKLAEKLRLESADMHYSSIDLIDEYTGNIVSTKNAELGFTEGQVPCWSLAALTNLLPSEFTTENKFGIFKYTIRIRQYKSTEDEDVYQIAYGNYKYYKDGSSSWKDMVNTGEKEELLDAAFDMICWLHEQKLI